MALDKLVDSSQLDSDLTSVANAIRTKGGTSAQLAFPADFVQAIEDIPTGGGGGRWTDDQLCRNAGITGDIVTTVTTIDQYALSHRTAISSFRAPNATQISAYSLEHCYNLKTVFAPKAKTAGNSIRNCTSLVTAVVGNLNGESNVFGSCSKLATADCSGRIGAGCFSSCTLLGTLIIRGTSIQELRNVSAFNGTKFRSGGAGGTIYIHKSLYDHLGDGSSLDYKAATNWSVIDGYGTITWAQIEGSIYETQYGDGTPIPTA